MNDILVMLLSTFNRDEIYISTAKDKDGNKYSYYHQMEPIPLMLKEKKQLDAIVALCTEETYFTKEINLIGKKDNGTEEINHIVTSAVDYFKSKFGDLFIPIKVDVKNPAKGINETIRKIREEYNGNSGLNLILDSHGGRRDIQNILQAVVRLLENEGINIKDNYVVDGFAPSFTILEDKQSIEINDFHAGMNEFFNTGKGDSLSKFIDSCPKNDSNSMLVKIINKISNAILLCDMNSFEDGLNDMDEWLKNRKEDESYIDIFIDAFKSDYGKLLDKENRGYIDIIEWCLKKKFYQQALTIVESKMPKTIINSKALFFDWDDIYTYNSGEKIYLETIINEAKKDWEEKENYLLHEFARTYVSSVVEKELVEYNYQYDDYKITGVDNQIDEYTTRHSKIRSFFELDGMLKNKKSDLVNESIQNDGSVNVSFYKDRQQVRINNINISLNMNSDEDNKKLLLLLKLHMTLKNQRNITNHGSNHDRRITIEELKDGLELYCELARELKINKCLEYERIKRDIFKIESISRSGKSFLGNCKKYKNCQMPVTEVDCAEDYHSLIGMEYEVKYIEFSNNRWRVELL